MLIVEDGTMPEGANTYVSLADVDAYLVPRGLWETTPDDAGDSVIAKKEAAIIRAFDAMNTLNWAGDVPDWQRVTAWPRENVPMPGVRPNPGEEPTFLPADMVPRAVVQAQMELAGLIYGGLNPLAPVERGGKVISMSESSKEGDLDGAAEVIKQLKAGETPEKEVYMEEHWYVAEDILESITVNGVEQALYVVTQEIVDAQY